MIDSEGVWETFKTFIIFQFDELALQKFTLKPPCFITEIVLI